MFSNIWSWLCYVYFLLCCLCNKKNYETYANEYESTNAEMKAMEDFGLFYNFESLKRAYKEKNFIVDEESKYNYVGRLIADYERRCPKNLTVKQKYPFIVVESLLWKCGREVSWHLARRMEAKGIQSPPLYMTGVHRKNINGEVFRNLFTTLGNYGSACEARKLTEFSPVIIQTHFTYQSTFAIAKKFSYNHPPRTSDIFHWPKDMFKPDLIIFINLPLITYQKLVKNTFREELIFAFRAWQDPKIIELNESSAFSDIANLAEEAVNRELKGVY